MTQTAWLAQRALLAIGLMFGFYAFAVAIAAGLLLIPYAEWHYLERVDLRIAAVCIGAAFAVLWAIVPRIDRFEPPGPRLEEAMCPGLFRLIDDVAAATGQATPSEVYLLNDVNAFVTHRGGVMGFGSRRVMGVGFPLLHALSQAELKAIIAHEFGHYSSGDVSLGPWIYKTRAAIGRAIEGVQETLVEAPFQWYGTQFLKLTHAVSRRQEFIADEVAARVAGAGTLASALRRVTALTPCFSTYLTSEVSPVLEAGYLPPIAAGFTDFVQSARMTELSQRFAAMVEQQAITDEFDTHPSLRDRLAALSGSDAGESSTLSSESASLLLPDSEAHALALLRFKYGDANLRNLKPLSWDSVAMAVYVPRWRAFAKRYSKWLSQFTADTIPHDQATLIRIGSDLVPPGAENFNSEQRIAAALFGLGVGLALALIDSGGQVSGGLGKPIVVTLGAETIDPFHVVHEIGARKMSDEEWKSRCLAMGLAGRSLASAPAAHA